MSAVHKTGEEILGRCAYLDGLGIELQSFLLVDQEFLNILTLITLKLDHLAHLRVIDDGAIASWNDKRPTSA